MSSSRGWQALIADVWGDATAPGASALIARLVGPTDGHDHLGWSHLRLAALWHEATDDVHEGVAAEVASR